jgi:hypothetical protein
MFKYEKHEPASISKEAYSFISICSDNISDSKKNWCFVDAPAEIESLNRYVVGKENIIEFISVLMSQNDVYSCIYLSNKAARLTKIQKQFKEKKLIKNGWEECTFKKELYIKSMDNVFEGDIDFISDIDTDSVLLVCKDSKVQEDLMKVLDGIDLFDQPKDISSYYPTKKVISTLKQSNVAIIYFKRLLEELSARDVFISYSPWDI